MRLSSIILVTLLSMASITTMAVTHHQQPSSPQLTGIDAASNNTAAMSSFYDSNQSTAMSWLKGSQNWFRHIHVSLLLNSDSFFQSFYQVNSLQPGSINNTLNGVGGFAYSARMNVDSNINTWVHAHLGLFSASGNPSQVFNANDLTRPFVSAGDQPYGINGGYATRYYVNSNQQNGIDIDEAYITFANASKAPVAFRVGRQYIPFGQYDLNAMMPTLYDQLVKTREQALTLGYYGSQQDRLKGVSLQVYGFNGIQSQGSTAGTSSNNFNAWGGTVGYQTNMTNVDHLKANLQAGYLSDYANVGLLNQGLDQIINTLTNGASNNGYVTRAVGAVALDANARFGQLGQSDNNRFLLGVHYVFPMRSFSTNDFVNYTSVGGVTTSAARPKAGSVNGGINLMTYDRFSQFQLSYQWTGDGAIYSTRASDTMVVNLPQRRVAGEYNINLMSHARLCLEGNWDMPYNSRHGGPINNKGSLTGIARLSVFFS